jgi:hypothetical protein
MNFRLVITDGTTTGLYAQIPFKAYNSALQASRVFCRDYYNARKSTLTVSIISVSAPIGVIRSGSFNGEKILWSIKNEQA